MRPFDHSAVQRASEYAAGVHAGDDRKGSGVPYLSHLWSVAALVMEHGGDTAQTIAALVHDVAEDHGGEARLADIEERFGPEVEGMARALSDSLADIGGDEVKEPWAPRKADYVSRLGELDDRTALVSACDKLHNLRSIVADYREQGPALWNRFSQKETAAHLWYYSALADALASKVPARLADELARTLATFRSLIDEHEPGVTAHPWTPPA